MKRLLSWVASAALFVAPALAEPQYPTTPPAPPPPPVVVLDPATGLPLGTASNPMNISGTFSATLGGFAPTIPASNISPATITSSASAAAALPTGTTVLFSNTGSNVLYVQIGSSGASATVSDIPIQPGSGCAVVIGAAVDYSAISPLGSTLNATGGSGLGNCPSGGGGGSGSGGGSTNATIVAPLGHSSIASSVPVVPATSSVFSIQNAAGPTPTTGTITASDVGTTCTATPAPAQTQCTGAATTGSFVGMDASGAGNILVTASTAGGTLSAVQLTTEISNDGITWYGRGLFLDSNLAPIEKNGIGNAIFTGSTVGGVPFYRIRATTFTIGSGSPVITITMTQTQGTGIVYVGNLPTGANGTASVAATSVQGNGNTALPVNTNQQQLGKYRSCCPDRLGCRSRWRIYRAER